MEGLLQAFKEYRPDVQERVCKLVGIHAKRRGQERNDAWQGLQKLWWKGALYDRHGEAYQKLLDRAFEALSHNADFQKALLATDTEPLTHSIGISEKSETCLTEDEFCLRLESIRTRLKEKER